MLVVASCTGRIEDLSPPAPAVVGPSPLRRLSNSEYLNALHDTFPSLHPTLPPLPDDATVAGFENAAEAQQPSDVRIARFETIANLYAEAATADAAAVSQLVDCGGAETPKCASKFIARLGAQLFRRPLTTAELARFDSRFSAWQSAADFAGAVQLTLGAMLQAPQFLYRVEPAPAQIAGSQAVDVEPYAMASRLAFFLWESVPDAQLLDAAEHDRLHTPEELRAQVERMLADERSHRLFWDFHRQWLGLDRILEDEQLVRTPDVDAHWSAASQEAASTEVQLFVEHTLTDEGSLPALLTSRRAWVNDEMARLYGVAPPPSKGAWVERLLPAGQRAGLFTRTAFLAGYSHRGATSPPVRGNALAMRLLCRAALSPPPGVDLSQPTAAPGSGPQTNRTLFIARTRPALCQTCHAELNGFGFGFERYNAAGIYQSKDNGLPVDASGAIHGTDVDQRFSDARELSEILSHSRVVHRCAAEQWVRYALGRSPIDQEQPLIDSLTDDFMRTDGDVRTLLQGIVSSPSFRLRKVEED